MNKPVISALERHGDNRGWVSEIYSGELGEDLRNVHLGTLEPEVVRGNHRHEHTREWISFLQTPVLVRWGTPDSFEETTVEEPSTVELPVGVPHAFKNTSGDTISFTAYTDSYYDEEDPDVISVELFPPEDNC